jgi:hypothetical protein
MWEWLEQIFGRGFMPHGHCYLWSPAMVWTQVSANTLIGFAYAAIASTLAVLVRRIRNIPFAWVYLAFGTFILSCVAARPDPVQSAAVRAQTINRASSRPVRFS